MNDTGIDGVAAGRTLMSALIFINEGWKGVNLG